MDKSQAWSTGNAIDNAFPISGFANTNYVSNFRNRLIIAGGRDKSGNYLTLLGLQAMAFRGPN